MSNPQVNKEKVSYVANNLSILYNRYRADISQYNINQMISYHTI
jgi:hypothetical protein